MSKLVWTLDNLHDTIAKSDVTQINYRIWQHSNEKYLVALRAGVAPDYEQRQCHTFFDTLVEAQAWCAEYESTQKRITAREAQNE